MKKLSVVVVIPAYNEEKSIKQVIDGVRQYCKNILVVIAKKNTDRTEEIVRSMKVNYIKDNGGGHGEAKRCAINYVKEDIIVFFDADLSHDPKDIRKLIKPIQEGRSDLVVGSRMLGGSDELHGTISNFMRNLGSSIIILIINYRWNVRLTDCMDGFRAIRTKVARALKLESNDYEIEEEMVIKAVKRRYRVSEEATHEYERKYGESKLPLTTKGYKFVLCLLKELI